MSTYAIPKIADYLALIERLPAGGALTLPDVSWAEYEGLLAALQERPGLRVNYIAGRLWIMSVSQYHEMYQELLQNLALFTADELGLVFESRGSTTFKEKTFRAGAEPDTCFYVQNAARIIGKRTLDLRRDPPPDVIVEIDITHPSLYKFAFYAQLGVPELWRYDELRLQILHLGAQGYEEAVASLAFPVLTAEALTQFLEQCKSAGQSAARRAFRQWLREQLAQ